MNMINELKYIQSLISIPLKFKNIFIIIYIFNKDAG